MSALPESIAPAPRTARTQLRTVESDPELRALDESPCWPVTRLLGWSLMLALGVGMVAPSAVATGDVTELLQAIAYGFRLSLGFADMLRDARLELRIILDTLRLPAQHLYRLLLHRIRIAQPLLETVELVHRDDLSFAASAGAAALFLGRKRQVSSLLAIPPASRLYAD